MDPEKAKSQKKKAKKQEVASDTPDSEEQKVESFECYDELADQKRMQGRAAVQ